MEFKEFKLVVQRRFNEMVKKGPIFQAYIDKNEIWDLYLNSFPEGTNPILRERSEHDCNACRSFIKNAGSIVQIEDGKLTSIWDLQAEGEYQVVSDALAAYVKSIGIDNVFLHTESSIGIDKNREMSDDFTNKTVRTWEHLHITLPKELQCKGTEIGPRKSEYQAMHDVVLRSLKEITVDAIETVQDLIAQNSLYRGAEKKNLIDTFAKMKTKYDLLKTPEAKDLFAWSQVVGPNSWVCKVRNDVIGTLLSDLSAGVDLELAVKKFEDKVSGTNYKRPSALVTPKMRDAAKKTIEELGLMSALDRRYAKLEDISITNVLFADRSIKKRLGGSIFDDIPTKGQDTKKLDKVEEVSIEKFISDILPTAKSLELFVENSHANNLVSLIAPCDLTAKSMCKWKNPFSWSYNGEVADSIKERVKAAGGNVTGDLCCRLAWFNHDDLDFHMMEPNGREIYFGAKGPSDSGGRLDVDMNAGGGTTRTPVENIFYPSHSKMQRGDYILFVNQFSRRESTNIGFEVEIDLKGSVQHISYEKPVKGKIEVAKIKVTSTGITVTPTLPATPVQKEFWGIKTQNFQPVTAVMLSPNHWDGEGIGNKHYFFMLDGCKNTDTARGFYNEFLSNELESHRRTMELVGSKARTDSSDDQMSGLGFSSTQRNSAIIRVHGSFVRTVKVTF